MSATSDLRYGRQGGRFTEGAGAEKAIAEVAALRAKARRAHEAGHGDPWPGDLPPTEDRAHPTTLARQAARARHEAEHWPDGLPTKTDARQIALNELALVRATPDDLEQAWIHRARMAAARLAGDIAAGQRHGPVDVSIDTAPSLDAVDREALTRHPDPPGILTLARKARP